MMIWPIGLPTSRENAYDAAPPRRMHRRLFMAGRRAGNHALEAEAREQGVDVVLAGDDVGLRVLRVGHGRTLRA